MLLLRGMIKLSIMKYAAEVLLRVVVVTVVAIILPVYLLLSMDESHIRLLIVAFFSVLCTLSSVYILGLSSGERLWVNQKIEVIIQKLKRR